MNNHEPAEQKRLHEVLFHLTDPFLTLLAFTIFLFGLFTYHAVFAVPVDPLSVANSLTCFDRDTKKFMIRGFVFPQEYDRPSEFEAVVYDGGKDVEGKVRQLPSLSDERSVRAEAAEGDEGAPTSVSEYTRGFLGKFDNTKGSIFYLVFLNGQISSYFAFDSDKTRLERPDHLLDCR